MQEEDKPYLKIKQMQINRCKNNEPA